MQKLQMVFPEALYRGIGYLIARAANWGGDPVPPTNEFCRFFSEVDPEFESTRFRRFCRDDYEFPADTPPIGSGMAHTEVEEVLQRAHFSDVELKASVLIRRLYRGYGWRYSYTAGCLFADCFGLWDEGEDQNEVRKLRQKRMVFFFRCGLDQYSASLGAPCVRLSEVDQLYS